ncbi:MAG: polymer-forming cytoskeletal protein [Spirochaetaceae bacterium]|jgi:cytoskeletal protein CcmA (bactofilin family)|nr:polymer-forming cytoskeletal protein [Spirochaetaceae bacterium]
MIDFQNTVLEDEDFDTILSGDIEFTGKIIFEKSFLVRGHISGEISTTPPAAPANIAGVLLIDENAVVHANIKADMVIIRGHVKGDVTASRSLEITATGTLEGDVSTPEINFHAGCLFNGRCVMGRN